MLLWLNILFTAAGIMPGSPRLAAEEARAVVDPFGASLIIIGIALFLVSLPFYVFHRRAEFHTQISGIGPQIFGFFRFVCSLADI